MEHKLTVESGITRDTIIVTGGVFAVAYDSKADETGRSLCIIRGTPKDVAEAMLGQDGLNNKMARQFAEGLCKVLWALLKKEEA